MDFFQFLRYDFKLEHLMTCYDELRRVRHTELAQQQHHIPELLVALLLGNLERSLDPRTLMSEIFGLLSTVKLQLPGIGTEEEEMCTVLECLIAEAEDKLRARLLKGLAYVVCVLLF
jgi:hypothetical protein